MRASLGIGISKNQVINDPGAIKDLVGWWDFTKSDTLFQNRDGTTAVTSDDDPIHWVRNLANGDGDGNRLGSFLRSAGTGSTYGATYKTGGLNGLSYAQFADDATDNAKGLRGGYYNVNSNLDGGIATNKFSDLVLNLGNLTVITVLRHDDADISSSDDHLWNFKGCKLGDTSTSTSLNSWKDKNAPDLLKFFWGESGGGYAFSNTDAGLDTNSHMIELHMTDGTGNMKVYIDGTVNSSPGNGDDSANIDFSKTTGATSESASVTIGGAVTMSTGVTNLAWQGRVYEHIVFNRALTTDEIEILELYIANKYGITIS